MSLSKIDIDSTEYTSYASLSEANEYLNADFRRKAVWNALTDEAKNERLVSATRELDMLDWKGEKAGGNSQTDAWPRQDVFYPDGSPVANNELPIEVEQACIILAADGESIAAPSSSSSTTGQTIRRLKSGDDEIEYETGTHIINKTDPDPVILHEGVLNLIRFYLATIFTGGTNGNFVGTQADFGAGVPAFTEQFERTVPYN